MTENERIYFESGYLAALRVVKGLLDQRAGVASANARYLTGLLQMVAQETAVNIIGVSSEVDAWMTEQNLVGEAPVKPSLRSLYEAMGIEDDEDFPEMEHDA